MSCHVWLGHGVTDRSSRQLLCPVRCRGCIPFPRHPQWVLKGKPRHTHTVSHWYQVPSLCLNVPCWACGTRTCLTCIHAVLSHCVEIITNVAHAVDPKTFSILPVTCLSQSRMFHSMKKNSLKCHTPGQKKDLEYLLAS